jgi:hypothetical protein
MDDKRFKGVRAMNFRVATWNMDHWKRTPQQRKNAWASLHASGFDAALLQETVPPEGASRDAVVWREIGDWRRFGTGVVSLKGHRIEEITTARSYEEPHRAFSLLGTFPGSVAIARIHPPDVLPIVLVSVYSVIDVYSSTTLLRQVADLVPLFDSVDGERVILGGDLNVSTQAPDDESVRDRAALGAVESLGLVDLLAAAPEKPRFLGDNCGCARGSACTHLGTHRHTSGSLSHLDYLFATPSLAKECLSVRLDDRDPSWESSDHCALIAEFDLQAPTELPLWTDRYVDDVETTLRAFLEQHEDWGIWTPGPRGPRFHRARKYVYLLWSGALVNGTPALLEIGLWRDEENTGSPAVAYAGFTGNDLKKPVEGLDIALSERQAGLRTVRQPYAEYVVAPFSETDVPPESELRSVLTTLIASARSR